MTRIENTMRIKVLGIGGGGNNAAVRILDDNNAYNIDTYLLNTEISKLKQLNKRNVLQIGKQTTRGLGAGANEKMGEAAAIESSDQIRQILQGTDMLFLTAGMGGGTGTRCNTCSCRNCKIYGDFNSSNSYKTICI